MSHTPEVACQQVQSVNTPSGHLHACCGHQRLRILCGGVCHRGRPHGAHPAVKAVVLGAFHTLCCYATDVPLSKHSRASRKHRMLGSGRTTQVGGQPTTPTLGMMHQVRVIFMGTPLRWLPWSMKSYSCLILRLSLIHI